MHNSIKFPKFVTHLQSNQLNDTKIISENRGARTILLAKGLYAFTQYRDDYPYGHVWMNLQKHNTEEYEAVPLKPTKKLT